MTRYPSYLMVSSKRYRQELATPPRFRLAWDDEISDYDFKCRTQADGFVGPDNPPAVVPFYSIMDERDRQRINMIKDPTWRWEETVIMLNDGDERKFDYWTGPSRAQFNTTGWPQLGYIGMCGNQIHVLERVGSWVRFETLKPTDWLKARSMTAVSHPQFIHHFTCTSWDAVNRVTKRIDSTGTPRGTVLYPLVTWEGAAWIPSRFVVTV